MQLLVPLLLLFCAHQHKAAGVKTKQNVKTTAATTSYSVFIVLMEGDRIPPLQNYGQALKQKDCFSAVLGDDIIIIAFIANFPIVHTAQLLYYYINYA